MSTKDGFAFLLPSLLKIGLCDSLANSWFEIFSFLIPLPANLFALVASFYQKDYKPLKQDFFDIYNFSDL